jgi:hypothetical protein
MKLQAWLLLLLLLLLRTLPSPASISCCAMV